MDTNYFLVDSDGQITSEEGQTEREAVEHSRFLREHEGGRYEVVRRDRLSPENQKRIAAYEYAVAHAFDHIGKRVA